MGSGEVPLVTVTIALDVLLMFGTKLLNGLDDLSIASILMHGFRGAVCVAACSVPAARNWLWIKNDIDTDHLTHANHEVTGHPHLITGTPTVLA